MTVFFTTSGLGKIVQNRCKATAGFPEAVRVYAEGALIRLWATSTAPGLGKIVQIGALHEEAVHWYRDE